MYEVCNHTNTALHYTILCHVCLQNCYFKSVDGHIGEVRFNQKRLNLHVALAAAASGTHTHTHTHTHTYIYIYMHEYTYTYTYVLII
jgi:hypothetical protein